MNAAVFKALLPKPLNLLLAFIAAMLLTLSFPDFDLWFLAWIAMVPLFLAIEREMESVYRSAILGWVFGTAFFFGSCWWLTFSMITYGGIPAAGAYLLVFIIVAIVGLFAGLFGGLLSILLKRFGSYAVFAAPFLWTAVEFGRFWLAFNNWNEIAYSQAFQPELIQSAQYGGIYLVGFLVVLANAFIAFVFLPVQKTRTAYRLVPVIAVLSVVSAMVLSSQNSPASMSPADRSNGGNLAAGGSNPLAANVLAIQANVPMSGLNYEKWLELRTRHVRLAEEGFKRLKQERPDYQNQPLLVIFSESPMNFMYAEDEEFRSFIKDFASKNNASVLFNSAEPNPGKSNYFNSAVLVDAHGEKIGQYDKIHLVPFGEYAPVPDLIAGYIPTLIGSFELGKEYDLFPVGTAKAGIMICYESNFPTLARRLVGDGADALIEMTNDGYLGDTGVLKQHLASAVFRAVETNRPVLRTTNVGISGYINERGEIFEPSKSYTEDVRVWTISKSDGGKTFYVKYGDWFAWLSIVFSAGLLIWSFKKGRAV